MGVNFPYLRAQIDRAENDGGMLVLKHCKELVGKALTHKINAGEVQLYLTKLLQSGAKTLGLRAGNVPLKAV